MIIKSFLRAFSGNPKLDLRCNVCRMRRPFCAEACGMCVACCPGHDDEDDEPKTWWSR